MPTCSKICFSSGIIGSSYSKAVLLSLDKAFSYHFSICQRAKYISFKEITAICPTIARWIETFRGSHLYIFYDIFAIVHGVQKISIRRKEIQPLCRIAMLYTKHDIEIQAHQISIKQNSLADILSHGQYTKIANKYPSLQITQSIFGTFLKAGI